MPTAGDYPLRLSDLIVMNCNTALAPEKVVWGSGPAGPEEPRFIRPPWNRKPGTRPGIL